MRDLVQITKNYILVVVIFLYIFFYFLPENFIFHIKYSQLIGDIEDCLACNPPSLFCSGHIKSAYAQRLLNAHKIMEEIEYLDE